MFFKRLFAKVQQPWLNSELTDFRGLDSANEQDSLATEYQKAAWAVLRTWGIHEWYVEVDVHQAGETKRGRKTFAIAVRITSWDRKTVLRLMLGLPVLERKIRKSIHAHWVSEASHLSGVWLNTTDISEDPNTELELKRLLVLLTTAQPGSQPATPFNSDIGGDSNP